MHGLSALYKTGVCEATYEQLCYQLYGYTAFSLKIPSVCNDSGIIALEEVKYFPSSSLSHLKTLRLTDRGRNHGRIFSYLALLSQGIDKLIYRTIIVCLNSSNDDIPNGVLRNTST
ncbi:Hypothetical protein FKW44_009299, partial [Caligus rogercresseyi]